MKRLLLILIVAAVLSIPTLAQQNGGIVLEKQGNHEGRQQLIDGIKDLENTTLKSIDYSTHQTADSYALLATAADLTPWWGELARLSLDTINSVVGAAMAPEDFLTPDGAKKALKDPSTFRQIIGGIKDSKNTLGAISVVDGFRGIFKDAESYRLSFKAISKTEDVARQEYKVSEDNTRTANSAWLELWTPSTTNGLLIPLRLDATSGEGNHKSAIWVNGLKAVRVEIKKSFDDFIEQVPDPLPASYPLNETLTYLENLTHELRRVDNRVVSFNVVKNGEIKKKPITLGMVQADRETAGQLYDAWMNKQEVQYDSTLYNTGETICSITTYTLKDPKNNFNIPKTTMKTINGVSEVLEYADTIQFFNGFPSELAEEITKPVDPLDALQGHSVAMTDDLVTETSNLWTISNETLKYLQYTWKSAPNVIAFAKEANQGAIIPPVTLEVHSGFALSVAFSPDGRILAAGGFDLNRTLWDIDRRSEIRILQEGSGYLECMAFSPDGRTLASSSVGSIKLWDTDSGTEIRTLEEHTGSVSSMAFSPDGRTLASGNEEGSIKLWYTDSGTEIRTLQGNLGSVFSVAFSPDGRILASGSSFNMVTLWDTDSGTQIRTLSDYRWMGDHNTWPRVAFSPDGHTLASGLNDYPNSYSTIMLWDTDSGTMIRTLEDRGGYYDIPGCVLGMAFSPDGRILASGNEEGSIKLWDTDSGTEIRTLDKHTDYVSSMAFSPDGHTLASGGKSGVVRQWKMA